MPARSLLSVRALPGLLIAALGVVLLLNNLDLIRVGGLEQYWPLLLVALGVQVALDKGSRVAGAVLVGVGVALQLWTLDLLDIEWKTVFRFWPIVLIGVGAQVLFRGRGRENLVGGGVLLTLGAYFLASNFDLISLSLFELWPIAVILAGVAMLRKAIGR